MTNHDATPHAAETPAAQAQPEPVKEPLPTVMHPIVSRLFVIVTIGMVIAGIVMMVMIGNSASASPTQGTIATLLLSVGAVGFAAWIVIQVLGRMVFRIMFRKM